MSASGRFLDVLPQWTDVLTRLERTGWDDEELGPVDELEIDGKSLESDDCTFTI